MADTSTQASSSQVAIEDMLKAGTHFGHLTSRWHPKMKPFIFMERNGIHIVDLMQTQAMHEKAADAAQRFGRQGKNILFVGTKKQARDIVRDSADACESPYVVERWLGGMLTNFQTIRRSIRRMEDLFRMEKGGVPDQLKKKERLMKLREREKLEATLTGISKMPRLPGALYVVDIRREHIAVAEARKLGIPIIAMVDTNCDPNLVDFPIPANDDALKSINLVTRAISDAVLEGRSAKKAEDDAKKAQKQQAREQKEAEEKRKKAEQERKKKEAEEARKAAAEEKKSREDSDAAKEESSEKEKSPEAGKPGDGEEASAGSKTKTKASSKKKKKTARKRTTKKKKATGKEKGTKE